ncbi:hypothetical protein [Aurantimonas endophytica]|uniref:Uncharacterized protein n=1 Tax=Aurantimonas endophytica TaxID=1522175 RepID=A0A7W6HC10_9HYPH|nr:hypothetical protein [Aurantimonas endophytica]MBB4002347.1 hypothetical protein [Aurantimonas endophytica]MCO6402029.1 hypothetical protein [Aurantimonas endophytica]
MIGSETPPGRFERLVNRLPEGAVLRGVFVSLLAVSAAIVYLDYRDLAAATADVERTMRTEPLPLQRPEPGDQVRPYLPRTIPVGPDRGEPTLPGYDGPVGGEAMAEPMRFVAAPGGAVTAIGRIEIGTGAQLTEFLAEQGIRAGSTVHLHSPGGSVDDAIEMAREIRRLRLSTSVPDDGYCASACPLVLAGGVTRAAGTDAWVGVHQVYAVDIPGMPELRDVGASISEIQATIARCQELLVEMGVDPAVWIKAMQTPPEELYVLTEDDLSTYRMVQAEPDASLFIGPPAPEALLDEGNVAVTPATSPDAG